MAGGRRTIRGNSSGKVREERKKTSIHPPRRRPKLPFYILISGGCKKVKTRDYSKMVKREVESTVNGLKREVESTVNG
jgi:hypothetical protein